jgi:hypothetical protein
VATQEKSSTHAEPVGAASCQTVATQRCGDRRLSAGAGGGSLARPPGQYRGARDDMVEGTVPCACAWTGCFDSIRTKAVNQVQTPVQGRRRDAGRGGALWRSNFGEGKFDRIKQINVELNFKIFKDESCRATIGLQLLQRAT